MMSEPSVMVKFRVADGSDVGHCWVFDPDSGDGLSRAEWWRTACGLLVRKSKSITCRTAKRWCKRCNIIAKMHGVEPCGERI